MTARHLTFIVTIPLLLSSCIGKVKNEFEPPSGVQLESGIVLSPLHIDEIIEHPTRFQDSWNDSLIRLLQIRSLVISCKGGERPDATSERMDYEFDSNGEFTRFEYFKEKEGGSTPLSLMRRTEKSQGRLRINIERFYGEESSSWVEQYSEANHSVLVRHKAEAFEDTVKVYHFGDAMIRFEKIGEHISGIRLVIPKSMPLSKAVNLVYGLGINDSDLGYANRIVTYTEHDLPVVSYQLSGNWAQLDRTEHWTYDHYKVIKSYEKYVNRTLIKKMQFNYSDDLILRSIESNGWTYTISYK